MDSQSFLLKSRNLVGTEILTAAQMDYVEDFFNLSLSANEYLEKGPEFQAASNFEFQSNLMGSQEWEFGKNYTQFVSDKI